MKIKLPLKMLLVVTIKKLNVTFNQIMTFNKKKPGYVLSKNSVLNIFEVLWF